MRVFRPNCVGETFQSALESFMLSWCAAEPTFADMGEEPRWGVPPPAEFTTVSLEFW